MRRPVLTIVLLIAGTALLTLGIVYRGVLLGPPTAGVQEVPEGDREIAFIHTSTNLTTWERFVAGAFLTARKFPDLIVNDSQAFPDDSTTVPELVFEMKGRSEKLRIRWYKLAGGMNTARWIDLLAKRDPAPLAIIGGGSSDRAIELATVLSQEKRWQGIAPLLFLTQATASRDWPEHQENNPDGFQSPPSLIDIYKGRTFRFCFTNLQMAQAVVDFVGRTPELRPQRNMLLSLSSFPPAFSSPWGTVAALVAEQDLPPPRAFALKWEDDPYSSDLTEEFKKVLVGANPPRHDSHFPWECDQLDVTGVPFSVGGFYRANSYEHRAAEQLLKQLPTELGQRSLLIVSANTSPARRVLRSLCGAAPLIGQHLVAVTGDSIGFSTLYRDAGFAWNIRALPVPLVAFTHANPIAWDAEDTKEPFPLLPPNGTDDAYRNSELITQFIRTTFTTGPLPDADELATRLHQLDPPFFDEHGDRLAASGEYILWLQPLFEPNGPMGTPVLSGGELKIYHRNTKGWKQVGDSMKIGTNELGFMDGRGDRYVG